MKKPVCIRGLKEFKNGCPGRTWNGEEGCQCWIEETVAKQDNPLVTETLGLCLDLWMFKLAWHNNKLTEGNQQAVEKFRNAMCEVDPNDPYNDNKAKPKADNAMIRLVDLLEEEKKARQVIIEHEIKKQIKYEGERTN